MIVGVKVGPVVEDVVGGLQIKALFDFGIGTGKEVSQDSQGADRERYRHDMVGPHDVTAPVGPT